MDYLEALFLGDKAEVQRLEEEAFSDGTTPLMTCSTISNSSSIRVFCCE